MIAPTSRFVDNETIQADRQVCMGAQFNEIADKHNTAAYAKYPFVYAYETSEATATTVSSINL
jgi:hypothetical protein